MSVQPGVYRVDGIKSPHPPAVIDRLGVEAGENPIVQLRVPELERTVEFSGLVEDREGRPVSGARVRVRSAARRGRVVNQARTGSEGEFSMEVTPEDSLRVEVGAKGFRGQFREMPIDRDTFLRFRLRGYPAFSVRVVDRNGHWIEDARVHAETPDHRRVVRRRADGLSSSGEYPILIRADALHRNLGVTETLVIEDRLAEGVLHQSQQVSSFSVSLQYPGQAPLFHRVHSEDGSFRFQGLPPGDVLLGFGARGLEKTRLQAAIPAASTEWLDIVMLPR